MAASRRIIENVDHWISSEHALSTSVAEWRGIGGAIRRNRRLQAWEVRQKASTAHTIALCTKGSRSDGETQIDGGVVSTQRNIVGRLLFVPAGQEFRSWAVPDTDYELTAIHIDPQAPFLDEGLNFANLDFPSALYIDDPAIRGTLEKLGPLVEANQPHLSLYAEALGAVLAVELLRWRDRGSTTVLAKAAAARGGLAAWQEKRLRDYIEDNLASAMSLDELAGLVRLSTFHFARAFKASFHMPPHRYVIERRIARAKELLADPALTVDAVALLTGFSGASPFSTTFRKATGRTPTEYRRALF